MTVIIDSHSPEQWDDFLRTHSGHLLQSHCWGDFKGAFGWHPVRIAVLDGTEIAAAAQILFRPLPGGLFSTAYIPRGPILDRDHPASRLLLTAIHQRCRRRWAISCKVEPDWADAPDAREWLVQQGFRPSDQTVQPRRSVVVDLRPSEEAILAQMKSKTRYNVRLAQRRGVTVRVGQASDLPTFYRLLQVTGARDGFGIHNAEYYAQGWRMFARQNMAALLLAEHEGRTLAGLMVFAFGRSSIYMYGASADEGRTHMPTYLLQWEAMRWAKARGCESYDLWGIPDLEEDDIGPDMAEAERNGVLASGMGGLYRFKRGFGGQMTRTVGAYDYVYNLPLYHAFCLLWTRRQQAAGQ